MRTGVWFVPERWVAFAKRTPMQADAFDHMRQTFLANVPRGGPSDLTEALWQTVAERGQR